jgi:O-antigen ligase
MSFNPIGFLLFIIIVVVPAYYLNKWMIKITRPKESFGRLMLYFLACVSLAIVYSAICIFVFTRIYPLPKK